MRKIALVVSAMLMVSCGMKSALVPPDKVGKPSAKIDEYWMPGKEEGDFKGALPSPPQESCVEIIERPGPLEESEKQQGTKQNEEQGSKDSQENPTGSD